MRIAVQDANILIDLETADLLDLWFELGVEAHTTDYVREELTDERQPRAMALIRSGRIVCHEIPGREMAEVLTLRSDFGAGLSIPDCSALWLSRTLADAALLTGDGALRKAATRLGVAVHGMLWILDQLVAYGALTPPDAVRKVEELMENGAYLPQDECDARIRKWNVRA